MIPTETDVAIVGAGPTGLTLAAVLQMSGIDHVLVDRQAEGANESRAAVVHARTMEVLSELGVTDTMIARGIITKRLGVYHQGHQLGTVDLGHLPTEFPYALDIPQSQTEAILLGRLTELGGQVHRPYEVVGLNQDDSGVRVSVREPGGATGQIRARYAVGADGAHSTVRSLAGIGFAGGDYHELFVLADARVSGVPDDEVQVYLSEDGIVVLVPLPGGRQRIIVTLGQRSATEHGVDQVPEHPGLSYIQPILGQRVPGAIASDAVWTSRFRVHHRLAERYRAGQVILAGDAAHVHSPAGGQGMNTGIQDASALGHALRAALGGDPAALDRYEENRRPVAQDVVRFTDRLTRMAALHTRPVPELRDAAAMALLSIPMVRNKLARTIAELDYR
jgi:2-polyprenyl-6-methoxyphenol hydroxylase-like FAD-dependent oxidoreductase